MIAEETLSGSDSIKIDTRAIASIAYLAATEIEGVRNTARDFKSIVNEIIGRKENCGISVKFDKNNEVGIKISLVIQYGYNIPEIASKVQDNVYHALEKMAGISVTNIDINVRSVIK